MITYTPCTARPNVRRVRRSPPRPTAALRSFAHSMLVLGLLVGVLFGCGSGESAGDTSNAATACLNATTSDAEAGDQASARVTIVNNGTSLDELITCRDATIEVDSSELSASQMDDLQRARPAISGNSFLLKLAAEVPSPKIVGMAVFGGSGLNDAVAGGTYTGTVLEPPYLRYTIELQTAASPNTFRWSTNGGASWVAQGVAITTAAQALSNGVTVTFRATTGHTVGDRWTIDAGILQATSVSIHDDLAAVGYAMAGAPYLGAIQILRLHNNSAQLKSQALIRDSDILDVHVSDNYLYVAGAHQPVVRPAFVERFALSGWNLGLDTGPVELSSFAATSVHHDSARGRVYVTDGDSNGLVILSENLAVLSSIPLEDARWVAVEGNTLAVARGCCGPNPTANGSVAVYDLSSGSPASPITWPFTGADINDAKTTVQILGGKIFLAAGTGGAQVINPSNGAVLARIPNPTLTGLSDSVVVANAVSADEDLMFISNGEAGVYVGKDLSNDFVQTGLSVSITLLGNLLFDSLESTNHVAFRDRYLLVAAGLGGTKVVRLHVQVSR